MPERTRMLAIPPDSVHPNMSVLCPTGGGVVMQGGGQADYFCGRCGRLLLHRVPPHLAVNVWFACPKCQWISGMDVDLEWAKYAIEQLTERKLTRERWSELLEDARDLQASGGNAEDLFVRNPDLGQRDSWLSKLNLELLIAVLSVIVAIYFGMQAQNAADVGPSPNRKAAKNPPAAEQLTPRDVVRVARELHRLQMETVQLGVAKSSGRHKGGRHRKSRSR